MGYTESSVADALAKRYKSQEWVFLRSVANATGSVARTADAMAFNLWPSRGLEIHGFEIKVSRGDFKKELDDPSKAEKIATYCDRWFIVAPDGIVKLEELPPTWGLIVVKGTETSIAKPAPKLESPKAPPRTFWMSVMRRFYEQAAPQTEIERRVNEAKTEAWKKGSDSATALMEAQLKRAKLNEDEASRREEEARKQVNQWMEWFGVKYPHMLRDLPLKQAAALLRPQSSTGLESTMTMLEKLIQDAQTLLKHHQELRNFIETEETAPEQDEASSWDTKKPDYLAKKMNRDLLLRNMQLVLFDGGLFFDRASFGRGPEMVGVWSVAYSAYNDPQRIVRFHRVLLENSIPPYSDEAREIVLASLRHLASEHKKTIKETPNV
jgi:hypothetical protein